MANQTSTPQTDPAAGTDPESDRIHSLDELARRQDQTDSKLDQILTAISGKSPAAPAAAQQVTQDRLSRPSTVAEQVQAELDRARREQASQEAAAARDADHQSLKDQVAKLAEAPPKPAQPRRQRMMWGKA